MTEGYKTANTDGRPDRSPRRSLRQILGTGRFSETVTAMGTDPFRVARVFTMSDCSAAAEETAISG